MGLFTSYNKESSKLYKTLRKISLDKYYLNSISPELQKYLQENTSKYLNAFFYNYKFDISKYGIDADVIRCLFGPVCENGYYIHMAELVTKGVLIKPIKINNEQKLRHEIEDVINTKSKFITSNFTGELKWVFEQDYRDNCFRMDRISTSFKNAPKLFRKAIWADLGTLMYLGYAAGVVESSYRLNLN